MLKQNIVKKVIEMNNADAFLFVSDVNRYWYTEFQSSYGFVVCTLNKTYLFLDKRYFQKAVDTIKDENIIIIDLKSQQQVLDLLVELGVNKLLVEKEYFLLSDFSFYGKDITKIIPFQSSILRIQKTAKELKNIQKACDIVCETMNWIQTVIEPGMTEIEVSNMVSAHMLDLGAEKNSFDPIVASGPNGAYPHHRPSNRVIENNEFVTIDMGCIYKGYCSDLTRTFPIGTPDQKLIDAYNVVLKSNETGIQSVKYKMNGNELDKICRDIISETEFKDYFVHSTGHGVGIEVHELPSVSTSYNKPLEHNSVITVEPGIYIPGLGGIRIEDMVLVDKNNNHITLTSLANKYRFN